MTHQLEKIMEKLATCVTMELEKGIEKVDTKELGEVVDMIKDMAEAIHFMGISEAMKEYGEEEEESNMYYGGRGRRRAKRDSKGRYTRGYEEFIDERDMDLEMNKMYYSGGGSRNYGGSSGGSRNYGGSNGSRNYGGSRGFSEGNESEGGELENYMKELGGDIAELIGKASPNEKAMAKSKLMEMANKM